MFDRCFVCIIIVTSDERIWASRRQCKIEIIINCLIYTKVCLSDWYWLRTSSAMRNHLNFCSCNNRKFRIKSPLSFLSGIPTPSILRKSITEVIFRTKVAYFSTSVVEWSDFLANERSKRKLFLALLYFILLCVMHILRDVMIKMRVLIL